ncbi:MAG: M2 family metallopeptidase, partial [Bacteroidota bacterium]
MRTIFLITVAAVLIFVTHSCNNAGDGTINNEGDMNKLFNDFVAKYEAKVKPADKNASIAYFNASISGKEEDYNESARLQLEAEKIYASKEDFETLKKLKDSGKITDPVMKRQLDVLYNDFLSNQIDESRLEEIVNLENAIQMKFSTYRSQVGEKQLSDNEIEDVLRSSTNSDELKEAWIACKKLGPVVADDIKKVVLMRNEVAKELGFDNYHEMSLKLSDQNPADVEKLFDELDELTRDTYSALKDEMDAVLAKKYGISKQELMPWHYQNRFFQQAPRIYEVNLDKYYKDKDLVELTRSFYAGIGMDVSDIIERSDLFEKPGKDQHAYCTDIDKEGDIRILCNVRPDYYWMNTMLHEFGHGVYDKYLDMQVPYSLRNPAHTFTTEAIAMMFGRLAANAQWIQDMTGISDEEKTAIAEESYKSMRLEQLVFSRWAQVMYRFEKSMYENPGQDLNKLWWDLVEKYQMIKKPADRNEPDWATKTHIANSPCYYHNYLLGELLASQLYYYITKNIIKSDDFRGQSFCNKPEVGKYLI